MFDAILIATDLSDTSERALDTALQLARAHGSALHLVHVIRDPATEPWAVDAFGVDFDALLEHVHSRAQREVTARVERLTLPGGKRARVLVGAPAAEILRYAKAIGADLIVVGSHGRRSIQQVFLGSVADRVLHEASCPVLVVRPAACAQLAVDDAA